MPSFGKITFQGSFHFIRGSHSCLQKDSSPKWSSRTVQCVHTRRVPNQRLRAPGLRLPAAWAESQPCSYDGTKIRCFASHGIGLIRTKILHQIQSLGTANLCLCEEFWCRQSKEMLRQIMKQIFWTVWMDWFWIMFTMKRKLKIYHMLIILTFGSFANPFLLRYFKNIFFIHLLLDGRHDLGKLQHFHQFPRKILQLSLLMSDGESVSWLAAARAKWSPIASFSSQLAANYRSWSIHCYQSDRASRKQLIHRTRSLRFHAHTDTFLPHPIFPSGSREQSG